MRQTEGGSDGSREGKGHRGRREGYTITSPKMKKSTTADVKEAAAKIKDQRFRVCTML